VSSPPPPPQVSPDGKFYWDGQRWVPIQAQAPSQSSPQVQAVPQQIPSGYEIKKKGHGLRNGLIGCVGIIALIFFIPFCAGLVGTSTGPSTSSSPGVSSPAASAAAATLEVLLDKTGSGINTTTKFSAASDWQIVWSYDCSGAGGNGNFQVYVYNSDGSLNDVAVNELGAKGSDTTNEHQGGTYYLQMNSECNWHVIVKG
jgi:hypothetical protein